MRHIRQQLLSLIEEARQQHQIHMPPLRLQAALLHQGMKLLPLPSSPQSKQTTAISAQTLSQHNLHRHLVLIRCPDQAFYLDAIKGYLLRQDIQPIAQQTIVLSMQCNQDSCDIELHQPQADSNSNFMFVALHLSTTLMKDCHTFLDDLQAILHAVELSIEDFPAMQQKLDIIADAIQGDTPHDADLLHWMNHDRYLLFGMQTRHLDDSKHRPQRLGLMRQKRTLNHMMPHFSEQLQQAPDTARQGVTWLHLHAMQHHLYSTTRVELFKVRWQHGQQRMETTVIGHFSRSARHANASQTPGLTPLWQTMKQQPLLQQSAFYLREIRTLFDRMPKSMLCSTPAQSWLAPLRQIVDLTVPTHMMVHRLQPSHGNMDYLFIAMHSRRFGPNIMHHILEVVESMPLKVHNHDSFGIGPYRVLFIPVEAQETWPSIEHLREQLQNCIIFWKDRARDYVLQHPEGVDMLAALHEIEQIPRIYQEIFSPEVFLQHHRLREAMQQHPRIHVLIQATKQGIEIQVLSPALIPLGQLIDHIQAFGFTATQEADVDFGNHASSIHISRIHCLMPESFPLKHTPMLKEALEAVLNDEASHDRLNALLSSCGMDIRQIAVLIALRNHLVQLIPEAGILSLSQVMLQHACVSLALYRMFEARHKPGTPEHALADAEALFEQAISEVTQLSDDRWFRAFRQLVDASLRSNAFLRRLDEPLAIKIDTRQLAFAPHPHPFREIFVSGTHMMGVHLRAGPVARGGIRYSDRPHDFRTEVLELMSTQVVKNGQIVPTGSKGGFVVHGEHDYAFVLQQYRLFIRALLSLTDNLIGHEVQAPQGMVISEQDRNDPYLVVAADKGTARFSDDANDEARQARFWLDDAFASGGQHGYDHKAFGITARGAWVCAAHHFAKLNKDAWQDELSVVGIGDMGGDVFGNGMLLNPNIRLLAAFNHRHIFLDPNPDILQAYETRRQLFEQVQGWDAYPDSAISHGGGVFERSAKRINISPEVQQALGIESEALSGEALIQAILQAPVDMLYNGGIGTYVKASSETHAQVQDPANDAVRVDADTLRCKVVCEGGNLGFTQRARIEYAGQGGLIHTDAIDNAAGVNMSDHEVNVKILFTTPDMQHITLNKRNQMLRRMGDNISEQCLNDNRTQAETLALAHMDGAIHLPRLLSLRDTLLKSGRLDRRVDPGFNEDEPLVLLPQLAVILGHEKNRIHDALNQDGFDQWSHFTDDMLLHYFPPLLQRKHHAAIQSHPLKSDIAHTRVTNHLINHMGMTTIHHIESLMDSVSVADICEALLIAEQCLDIPHFRTQLQSSGLPLQHQHTLMLQVQEHTLHLALELLRLFDMRDMESHTLKQQKQGMRRFYHIWKADNNQDDMNTEVAAIEILSHMATASYLHHTHEQSLMPCFHATHISLQSLPFAELEHALSQADWGTSETHPLRREWLQRLTFLKTEAARQVLGLPRSQQRKLEAVPWAQHPHHTVLQNYQRHTQYKESPMQVILLLTQLESLLQASA